MKPWLWVVAAGAAAGALVVVPASADPRPAWALLLAAVCGLPFSGGISAGLLGALLPWLGGLPTVQVVGAGVLTALVVRTSPAVRPKVVLALAVLGLASGLAHQSWVAALPLIGPGAAAWLLSSPGRRPVGCITLMNSLTALPTFIILCLAMPLLWPVLRLSGSRHPQLAGWLMRTGTWLILHSAVAVRWRWEAPADLPAEPWVLISNHSSMTDILTCLALPGRGRALLAKPWVFRLPILGWAATQGGMLPVAELSEGRLPALSALSDRRDVVIFPEGTRHPGPELGRFRSGAVQAAEDLGRPLVAACQFSNGTLLPPRDPWIRPAQLVTRLVVPLIPAEGTRTARSAALRDWLQQQLATPPAPPFWLDLAVRWESAAQQGLYNRWRALLTRRAADGR